MSEKKKKIIPIVILICSFLVTIYYNYIGYRHTEATTLNVMVKQITDRYRIYQILATMSLYLIGYIIAVPFCKKIGREYAYTLAMPVGNASWGVISALVLFLNIPYNRYSMLSMGGICIGTLLYIYREEYKSMEWQKLLGVLLIALSISMMAASGVFAIFTSSDSYYFVMQYGELIAKCGKLSSDTVGTYMTWTGIMPALMSAFATMWGFENIYAIHYLLIFSMYGFVMLIIYKRTEAYYNKVLSRCIAVLTALTIAIIPGSAYLSFWIIGNSYFMVYLLLVVMLPFAVQDNKLDENRILLMTLFFVWLALCRSETAVTISFLVICISILGLSKKQMEHIFIPICVFQTLFFFTIIYQSQAGEKQADDKLLTPMIMAVIILALLAVVAYILIYDSKFAFFVRRHMMIVGIATLSVGCLVLGILEWDKFTNNVRVIFSNATDWYWNYVPITVLCLEIMKIYLKCRNRYFDLIVWGLVLLNFAICMGRPQYLRLGIGDSYNRICMSILPTYITSCVYTLVEYFGGVKKEKIK